MEIEVSVPSLLSPCTEGKTRFLFNAPASRLDEAILSLFQTYPLLRRHVCDERDHIRRHVLLFHNAERVRCLDQSDIALQPGDRLQVLQNVSGG